MDDITFWNAPTMDDVRAGEDKKLFTHVSLFAGLGGSSTGMRLAGAHTLGISEFIDYRNEIYSRNYPHCPVWNEDIRTLSGEEILKRIGLKKGQLDLLDGSPPCYVPDTMIKTREGYKKIQDILVGDLVLTHKQRFMPVNIAMKKKYAGKMITITSRGGQPITCTPEHPIYIRRMTDDGTLNDPKWIDAQFVTKLDYVGIGVDDIESLPNYSGIEYKTGFNRTTRIFENISYQKTLPLESENFWWIVGRYIGDGWVRYNERFASNKVLSPKKNRASVKICCDKTDGGKELKEITEHYDAIGFKYTVTEHRTVYRVNVGSREFCKWILQFGRGAGNKHLTKDVFDLPKNLMESFIEGYLSADGNVRPNNNYAFSSISKELVYGISYCIMKSKGVIVGKMMTRVPKAEKHIIEGREVNSRTSYGAIILSSSAPNKTKWIKDGNIYWVNVLDVTNSNYDGYVYNMSVEEDESYTANHFITHNCSDFSTNNMGKRESHWGHEKKYSNTTQRVDDLFYEFARVLKEVQPKVFVAENVKGLTTGNAKTILGDRSKSLQSLLDIEEEENTSDVFKFNGKDETIVQTLRDCGYKVSFQILNCAEYGIPQIRERLIFIGIRNDLPYLPSFPKPTTSKNRIIGKDAVGNFLFNGGNVLLNPETMTYDYVKKYFPPHTTKLEVLNTMRKNGFGTYAHRYHRDNWDKVFYTVVAQDGNNVIHSIVDRYWSVCEVKKIQSFPDDFIDGLPPFKRIKVSANQLLDPDFVKTLDYMWKDQGHQSGDIRKIIELARWKWDDVKDQKIFDLDLKTEYDTSVKYLHSSRSWENIGRAVPPLLYKAVGEHVYNNVLKYVKDK